MDYLDLGSSSDSGGEDLRYPPMAIDSDEEERLDNSKILQMLSMKSESKPIKKATQKMLDFESEMEAELDRRASFVESEGGMEHQRSLSRSSSSFHSIPGSSSRGGGTKKVTSAIKQSPQTQPSSSSSSPKTKKVKFAEPTDSANTEEGGTGGSSQGPTEAGTKDDSFYDKIYFDSDESEGDDEDVKTKRKSKRKLLSNDDLFYDPNSDAADQAWVDKQRRRYCKPKPTQGTSSTTLVAASSSSNSTEQSLPSTSSTEQDSASNKNVPTLPRSDAILNCPACFTLLCLDCQRHEFYVGQFRAML